MEKIVIPFFALCLWVSVSIAQEIDVRGRVTDAGGEPLAGVSVSVKGRPTVATSTGEDGGYQLKVPANGTLVFSYIGFGAHEEAIDSRQVVNVVLDISNEQLEEVVVIGYGTQRRGDVTTSIATVSTKDIEERPILQAAQALQGKAAGVQVTQPTGKPGQGLSIRVRGATSVQAGNEPLYVIDGVPTMDARDLNVNDIASMQVLKDASSAAIYGARASNGVVIITTKRGVANTSNINFNAYYGVSNVVKQVEVLDPQQYRELMSEMGYASGLDGPETTNWLDEVFTTGQNQNYQLSLQGGGDKTQYFISGAYTKDEGMIKPARYNRTAFRANIDNQVKDWLKVASNFSYTYADLQDVSDNNNAGRNAVVLGALGAPPTMGIYMYDEEGRAMFTMNPNNAGWDNPLAAVLGPQQGTINNRIFGNVQADLSLTNNFSLRSNVGVEYLNHKWHYFVDPVMTTGGRNPANHGLGQDEKSNSFTYLWENTANYNQTWGGHNLDLLGGMTIQKNSWNNSYIAGRDFPKDLPIYTLNAANDITSASTLETEWFLNSYLARAMYNYESKYLLTLNMRADGSSKLSPNHRWGYFPSVSAGWRISAEPFFESVAKVDDLKIRAGWGQNGNVEGLANYASFGVTSFQRRTPTSPLSGPGINNPSGMPNPDLRWETTTQTNVGVDLSMFGSRLNVTAEAYLKKTDDLILNVTLPNTTGYSFVTRNVGNMENKGLEFVVSSVNVQKENLNWSTDFNISFNRNRVTQLDLTRTYRFATVEGRADQIILMQPGLPLGTYFGYVSDGVDPSTGDMIYRDVNGDGSVTASDRTILGSAQPDFIYGLNSNLQFRNWEFSFLFQGSQGNYAFNASRMETEGMYDSKNQSTEVLRRWTSPGQATDIPRATAGNVSNSRVSSRFVEDASFLRLKSATLSYNLAQEVASRLNLNRVQLYVTGQNLITITNYKGFDPEVNAFGGNGAVLGIDYGTYPTARTFIVGVNMQF